LKAAATQTLWRLGRLAGPLHFWAAREPYSPAAAFSAKVLTHERLPQPVDVPGV